MAETIRRVMMRIGNGWFLERDPFDIGSGGRYYRDPYVPAYESAEEAILHDGAVLFSDMQKVGRRIYANA